MASNILKSKQFGRTRALLGAVQICAIWGQNPMAILANLQGSCVQMVESSRRSTIWSLLHWGSFFSVKDT